MDDNQRPINELLSTDVFGLKALEELDAADSPEKREGWRITNLGRRGALNELMRHLSKLPPDQRASEGQRLNAWKRRLEDAFETAQRQYREQELAQALEEE